jgi:methylated-DNA-protein-cysteine methyltransferase-like protein
VPSRKRAPHKPAGAVFARVHAWVAKIPRGRVATYGQISQLIEGRLSAVGVGWAMRAAGPKLPWHRVVNATGGLSTEAETPGRQRALLTAEGVRFLPDGTIDLSRHQWRPRAQKSPRGPGRKRVLRGL